MISDINLITLSDTYLYQSDSKRLIVLVSYPYLGIHHVLYIDKRIRKRATTYTSGDSFWLSQNYNTLKDLLRKLKNTLYI